MYESLGFLVDPTGGTILAPGLRGRRATSSYQELSLSGQDGTSIFKIILFTEKKKDKKKPIGSHTRRHFIKYGWCQSLLPEVRSLTHSLIALSSLLKTNVSVPGVALK